MPHNSAKSPGFRVRKDKPESTADWRDEYEGLEEDVTYGEKPIIEEVVEERETKRDVDMSELLQGAKVKQVKLTSGYEFLPSPASNVVAPKEEERQPGESDEDWVHLEDEEHDEQEGKSAPERNYSKAVTGAGEKT